MQSLSNSSQRTRLFTHPFCKGYWKSAAKEFTDVRMLVICAVITALRIVVKAYRIPIPAISNCYITFGFFFNALGSMIYGPLLGLLGGCISDSIGYLLFPSGPWFFPYTVSEMLGSLIFALFLYRSKLSTVRVFLSRFAVTIFCTILFDSFINIFYMMKFYGKSTAFLSIPKVVKNIILYPAQSILLVLFLNSMMPFLRSLSLVSPKQSKMKMDKRHFLFLAALFVVCIAATVVLYYLYFYVK